MLALFASYHFANFTVKVSYRNFDPRPFRPLRAVQVAQAGGRRSVIRCADDERQLGAVCKACPISRQRNFEQSEAAAREASQEGGINYRSIEKLVGFL